MGKPKGGIQVKVPKGTRDWQGPDLDLRNDIQSKIIKVFKRHGCVPLDTPVFERNDILGEKYGEDQKLIYALQDQGGELCSLRYDLTVPFARWLAMNSSVQKIKRYQIAKVYRRDQPAVNKGRMREFYQCDIDIAGVYDPMIPDAEILRTVYEVFQELGWDGKYTIKINHRAILDGIFAVCGVPEGKIRAISSAVDKLDKSPWDEVKREMVEEKGLSEEVADKIWSYVQKTGGEDVLVYLQNDEALKANERMVQGMDDMALLYKYLKAYKIQDKVEFNLSLARGLDYYTGIIYEVVTEGSAPAVSAQAPGAKKPKKSSSEDPDEDRSNDPTVGIGSIAAGGRYDDLVGMFSGKKVPCVGVSFGFDRIFSIMKARENVQTAPTVDVYVMAFGSSKTFTGLLTERMAISTALSDAGISNTFTAKEKAKLPAQFKEAEREGAPWAIILGEDEYAQGKIKIKQMGLPDGHPEKDGVVVDMADMVSEIGKRLLSSNTETLSVR